MDADPLKEDVFKKNLLINLKKKLWCIETTLSFEKQL